MHFRSPVRISCPASVRFRAIWLIHNPSTTYAMPAIPTFRIDNSMKNRITNRCNRTGPTGRPQTYQFGTNTMNFR